MSMTVGEFKDHAEIARIAFDKAIAEDRLSENQELEKFAGNYMFMGFHEGKDLFKNIMTRKYDV